MQVPRPSAHELCGGFQCAILGQIAYAKLLLRFPRIDSATRAMLENGYGTLLYVTLHIPHGNFAQVYRNLDMAALTLCRYELKFSGKDDADDTLAGEMAFIGAFCFLNIHPAT